MVALADILGARLIAEGVETVEEFEAIRDCGISLMQGYLFAKPAFEALPPFQIPSRAGRDAGSRQSPHSRASSPFCARKLGLSDVH